MTGSALELHDKIKDNDPRMSWRGLLTITALDSTHVWAELHGRTFRIRRDRIHTDGKPRRSGFDKQNTSLEPLARKETT